MANIWIRLMFIALLIVVGYAQPPSGGCTNKNVLQIIKNVVTSSVKAEPRMGASLLRLHFHDCFVQGCDASVLLDDNVTISFTGEKTAAPNNNSLRGFDVIDKIKSQVEVACPRRISCADILAVAARDAVVVLGGQSWNVAFGRNDSTTASLDEANSVLPGPSSDLVDLIGSFSNKNFTREEMVALSGSHTIGQARCLFFRNRIYTETNIDAKFANATRVRCPQTGGDDNLSPLDKASPNKFNNDYYKNLVNMSGLFHSDQQLFSNGSTVDAQRSTAQVRSYVARPSLFAADFARAMVKMSTLPPNAGAIGKIRTNCRRVD